MGTKGRAWLSPQGFEQVRDELERLLTHRSSVGHPDDGADADAWARHKWRERRIRRLRELLSTADVGGAPPDDGVAEAGMVVTVRFDDSAEAETFLLADSGVPDSATMEVCSSASPIGRALVGAREGDTRVCRVPGGRTISITLLAAEPYSPLARARTGHDTDRERLDHAQ